MTTDLKVDEKELDLVYQLLDTANVKGVETQRVVISLADKVKAAKAFLGAAAKDSTERPADRSAALKEV